MSSTQLVAAPYTGKEGPAGSWGGASRRDEEEGPCNPEQMETQLDCYAGLMGYSSSWSPLDQKLCRQRVLYSTSELALDTVRLSEND